MTKNLKSQLPLQANNRTFKDFGSFLTLLRVNANLTQETLSEMIGAKKQAISLWEMGRTFPSTKFLDKIAHVFHVSIDEIIRLKQMRRKQYLRKLIQQSGDFVVTASGQNFVPLLDKSIQRLPREAIQDPLLWKGERCLLPDSLLPGHIFAFKIEDRDMEPQFFRGNVVLVDTQEKPKNGDAVVVKLFHILPVCRIYTEWKSSVKILKTSDNKFLSLRVKENHIEWCYKVIKVFPAIPGAHDHNTNKQSNGSKK